LVAQPVPLRTNQTTIRVRRVPSQRSLQVISQRVARVPHSLWVGAAEPLVRVPHSLRVGAAEPRQAALAESRQVPSAEVAEFHLVQLAESRQVPSAEVAEPHSVARAERRRGRQGA